MSIFLSLYNLHYYTFISVNNVKTTVKQYFKSSVFIYLFFMSTSFIKLYVRKLSYQAHTYIIYITLKKNVLKTCIKVDIYYELFNCFKSLSFILVFFTSVIYNKVKSTSIIEIHKSIFLFLYYIYSLTLKKSSVKLKTKYNKLIIKKSFLAIFTT